MTVAFSQEKMSSGGVQLSQGVSTLNDNPLQCVGSAVVASHCQSPPGPQLNSSLLFQSQQDTLAASSPDLQTAAFLSLPAIPRAVSIFHTDCAGKPLHILVWRFFCLSSSKMSPSTQITLSWHHLYLPWLRAVSHPTSMCTIVPLHPHSLHNESSLIPHLWRFVGDGECHTLNGAGKKCERPPVSRSQAM